MAGVAGTSEDVVTYCLFSPLPDTFDDEVNIDFLEKRLDACLAELSDVLLGYIWQKDPFNLRVSTTACADSTHQGVCPLHLSGRTAVGDNIEDEWFIVHLLLTLTKKFPDLIVNVLDTDGQFLLIEAAEVIPKWLQPETSENRVWLYKGQVHLIPLPEKAEDAIFPFFTPSIEEALACIRQHSSKTQASAVVQASIHARLKGYPEKSRQLMHRAHCYVPAAVAVVLREAPNLVGAAVHAFVHRDPSDLQACRTFTHFRPGTRVMTGVLFNRCQYAQLMQQRFTPDKRSGFTLPAPSHKDYRKHDLGMKLAHGFEILCSRCSASQNGAAYRVSNSDARWNRYLKALQEKGYFRGEIDGSKTYCELRNKAKLYFEAMINSSNNDRADPGRRASEILDSVDYNIDKLRQAEKTLEPEHDDAWLTIDDVKLEEIFRARGGIKPNDDPNKVIDSMKSFVEHMSSFEGAEFPDDDDEEKEEGTGFIHHMHKMFEFEDDHGSSSGMSEYSDDDDVDTTFSRKARVDKSPDEISNMTEYMQLMDRQLSKTKMGESFVRGGPKGATGDAPTAPPRKNKPGKQKSQDRYSTASVDIDDLEDDFVAVNVDVNLVQNMLHSYQSQHGQPGPASNLVQAMNKPKKNK